MADRYDDLLAHVGRHGARAMMALNKLQVGESVRKQRLLADAKDHLAELLDAIQAAQEEADA